jgi:hypothetical protein
MDMSIGSPVDPEAMGLKSMRIPTIAVIGEILANGYIIWFLLIDYPIKCAHLAAETAGRQMCGLEAGAYIIAVVSAVMILGGVYFLARWSFSQDS